MKPFFDQILKNISELIKSIIPNAKKHFGKIIVIILIIFLFNFYNKELIEIANWFKSLTIAISEEKKSSNTLRNISLSIFGILALILAIWRSLIASNQWKTSEKQWRTAEEGQQTDRYQKAAQMLASENETERIGAIYALRDLVLANPERYYITIMDLFCAYLRKPLLSETEKKNIEKSKKKLIKEFKEKIYLIKNENINEDKKQRKLIENEKEYKKKLKEAYPNLPADRQLICEIAFATLRDFENYEQQQEIEGKWHPYLEKAELFNLRAPTNAKLGNYNFTNINAKQANFSGAYCDKANFSGAICKFANFSGAECIRANFSAAICEKADFSGAECIRANFSGAICKFANFSGANCYEVNFSGAICFDTGFFGAMCRNTNFSCANCLKANFSVADCSGADFSVVSCKDVIFAGANCESTDFSQSKDLFESQIENAFVFGDCSENNLPKIPDGWNINIRDLIYFIDPNIRLKYFRLSNEAKLEVMEYTQYVKKWHEWDEDIRKSWLDGSWIKDKK